MSPHIKVYASLPKTVPDHDSSDNWRWVHCLSIPLDSPALQFSHKPYKWICFAIGVVVGAEGVLSRSSISPIVIPNIAVLPSASIKVYYHTSTEERQRMFPIDPDIARTCVTSTVRTARREGFRDGVAGRDGRCCLITGIEEVSCDAVHLVSHSKGDTYISNYTQHRSRDPTGDDIIHDIDNIRNGLFLSKNAHPLLGTTFAFLMTPNFALNTSDIDPDATPTEMRCTSHVFQRGLSSHAKATLRPGSSLWLYHTTEYPPAILFDAAYAAAVLHHFGTERLRDSTAEIWGDTFYPQATTHADYQAIFDQGTSMSEARNVPDVFDMLMILPYVLVPPNELRAAMRDAKERAAAAEQRRVQEKVGAWARQIGE